MPDVAAMELRRSLHARDQRDVTAISVQQVPQIIGDLRVFPQGAGLLQSAQPNSSSRR